MDFDPETQSDSQSITSKSKASSKGTSKNSKSSGGKVKKEKKADDKALADKKLKVMKTAILNLKLEQEESVKQIGKLVDRNMQLE